MNFLMAPPREVIAAPESNMYACKSFYYGEKSHSTTKSVLGRKRRCLNFSSPSRMDVRRAPQRAFHTYVRLDQNFFGFS